MKAPQSQTTQIVLTTIDAVIVKASDARVGLVFYPCGAAFYAVDDQALASSNVGILVNTSGGPIELWADRHGNVVKNAWHGFANAGPITISVLEVFD